MRKIITFCLLAISSISYSKPLSQSTAQSVAYNYYKNVGKILSSDDLSLAYTASNNINGAQIADFYVFNVVSSAGFIIVSADDIITPILGFSTESAFNTNNIPPDLSFWLKGYQNSIARGIGNGTNATAEISEKWNTLLQPASNGMAAKTTNNSVLPMVTTMWNQDGIYNAMCPYDYSYQTNVLTGCVATAMAQVMRFWKWPDTAVGSNSYNSNYGMLQVNYNNSVYSWDSMVINPTHANNYIAKLMYDAGVSVDMGYGVTESGSYVTVNENSVCAQTALQDYFRYKHTMAAVERYSKTDSQWVSLLQNELLAGRPIIYEGSGPQGGHCFVNDGYFQYDHFHFNWGWGGSCNGYFIINSLTPGNDTFNDQQAVLINIIPDTPVTIVNTGIEQVRPNDNINIYPNPAKDEINIASGTQTITEIHVTDMLGREVIVNYPLNKQFITLPVRNLVPGVYNIQLATAKGRLSSQIVITK